MYCVSLLCEVEDGTCAATEDIGTVLVIPPVYVNATRHSGKGNTLLSGREK